LVADLSLDRHILQEIVARNRKTSCAAELAELAQQVHRLSQRRAARLIPVERMTMRYEHYRGPQDALRVRLRELAGSRDRYGYRPAQARGLGGEREANYDPKPKN